MSSRSKIELQSMQTGALTATPWFLLLCLSFTISVSRKDNVTDLLSLLSFKSQITNDPFGSLSGWNSSIHFCKWRGITCGRRHQRVTRLDLDNLLLKGPLSPHIGNLSFLRIINLNNNSFTNQIPEQIGRLFRLQVLNLRNNSFDGVVPANISRCSKLRHLNLGRNNISGQLPKDMDSLSKLQRFQLYVNNFVGEIPASLGNISALQWFLVSGNKFHGSIPDSLGRLTRLTTLDLSTNNLSGTVPSSIYNLSFMEEFYVFQNQLEGSLPPDLGYTTFPNIGIFLAYENLLSGSIPVTMSNASNLSKFGIASNKFTGKVPSLASLLNLVYLGINSNSLGYGNDDDLDFIYSLVNCTIFQDLVMEGNNFGGVLPKSLSNFSSKFRAITCGGNHISGSLPAEIGNLISLEIVAFEQNQIEGRIPSSLCKLKNLHILYLPGNKLSGTVPSFIGNLTSLFRLSLTGNNLEGSIPSSLGECNNLQEIYLSQNNLSGSIPQSVLSLSSLSLAFDLSRNHFTGFIHNEVGRLVNLVVLDFSENKLHGEIPETLGSCTSLEYLYLQGNLLHGIVPKSLASLRGIEEIDLSNNNLCGTIPISLEDFPFLVYLNLSFNDFEGELPVSGVFQNVSELFIMGNKKLCGGITQLNLPKCTFDLHKKHKVLSSKWKLIVSVVCALVFVILVLVVGLLYRLGVRARRKSISRSSSFGVSFLKISYAELSKATNGFSSENLIGIGSFGSVYKGILDQGERVVAVKVLNLQTSRASKSFVAECKALKNIKHRNLVKLITACSSIDFQGNAFKALVYEFMVNGSLEEWIHSSDQNLYQKTMHLNLIQRVNIAVDVGSALDYMHNQSHMPVVHCDLKPSNILLDSDMIAHVADFGVARFLPNASHPFSSDQQTSSIGIKGSIGYAAPEYGLGHEVSKFGDVYSYGILLLEMFTGKRPTDSMFKDGFNLQRFVLMALPGGVEEILDPALVQRGGNSKIHRELNMTHQHHNPRVQGCLISIFKIGVACSAEVPKERMEITDVVVELCHIKDELIGARISRDNRTSNEA